MNDIQDANYLRQISVDIKRQIFKCPWGAVIMKNEETSELIYFKSKQHYKNVGKKIGDTVAVTGEVYLQLVSSVQ